MSILGFLQEEIPAWKFLIAGLLIGIGVTFKVPALLDGVAIGFVYTVFTLRRFFLYKDRELGKKYILSMAFFAIGILVPICLYATYFAMHGAFKDFVYAVFLANTSYVSYFNASLVGINALSVNTTLLILLLAVTTYIYIRQHFDPKLFFFLIWTSFAIYSVMLSGRPYGHYVIQAAVPVAVLMGYIMSRKNMFLSLVTGLALVMLTLYFTRNTFQSDLATFIINVESRYYLYSYEYMFQRIDVRTFRSAFPLGIDSLDANTLYAIKSQLDGFPANGEILEWGNLQWLDAATPLTPVCKYLNNFDVVGRPDRVAYIIRCVGIERPEVIVYVHSGYDLQSLEQYISQNYKALSLQHHGLIGVYVLKH